MNSDQFFCTQYERLAKLVFERAPDNLNELAKVLRQMFLDDEPLLDLANKERRMKISFTVTRSTKEELASRDSERPLPTFLWVGDRVPGGEGKIVKRDAFLAHTIMFLNGQHYSVKNLILSCSNALGGVHYQTRQNDDKDQAAIRDLNDTLRVQGISMAFRALVSVATMVEDALEPLYTATKIGRSPTIFDVKETFAICLADLNADRPEAVIARLTLSPLLFESARLRGLLAEAHARIGMRHEAIGETSNAINQYRQALHLCSSLDGILHRLGRILTVSTEIKFLEEGVTLLKRVVEMGLASGELYWDLAQGLSKIASAQHDVMVASEAKVFFVQASRSGHLTTESLTLAANICAEIARFFNNSDDGMSADFGREAENLYGEALSVHPNEFTYYNQGVFYHRRGLSDQTSSRIAFFQHAAESYSHSECPEALIGRGNCYLEIARLDAQNQSTVLEQAMALSEREGFPSEMRSLLRARVAAVRNDENQCHRNLEFFVKLCPDVASELTSWPEFELYAARSWFVALINADLK